jgi:hypothetical protein
VTKNKNEIPRSDYWAITEKEGAQLINPNCAIHGIIAKNIGEASIRGIADIGDILVVAKSSFVISPESVGLNRIEISEYDSSAQTQIAKSGLRRAINKYFQN